jgi:Ca2+/Na+ antiporter
MAAGKAGIALIIVGSVFLAAGIVIGIVFQVYVREHAFDNYLVYSRNSR